MLNNWKTYIATICQAVKVGKYFLYMKEKHLSRPCLRVQPFFQPCWNFWFHLIFAKQHRGRSALVGHNQAGTYQPYPSAERKYYITGTILFPFWHLRYFLKRPVTAARMHEYNTLILFWMGRIIRRIMILRKVRGGLKKRTKRWLDWRIPGMTLTMTTLMFAKLPRWT